MRPTCTFTSTTYCHLSYRKFLSELECTFSALPNVSNQLIRKFRSWILFPLFCTTRSATSFVLAVLHVVLMRSFEKMGRLAANRVIAAMKDVELSWTKYSTMSRHVIPSPDYAAVSARSAGSGPLPTTRRLWQNSRHNETPGRTEFAARSSWSEELTTESTRDRPVSMFSHSDIIPHR